VPHGFPDSAHSWRHLLPRGWPAPGSTRLARSCAAMPPTEVPEDGVATGALTADGSTSRRVGRRRGRRRAHRDKGLGRVAGYGAARSRPRTTSLVHALTTFSAQVRSLAVQRSSKIRKSVAADKAAHIGRGQLRAHNRRAAPEILARASTAMECWIFNESGQV